MTKLSIIKKFKCTIPDCNNYFLFKREICVFYENANNSFFSFGGLRSDGCTGLIFITCKKCFSKYKNGEILKILKNEFQTIRKAALKGIYE